MHEIITHAEQLDVQISAAMFAQLAANAESKVSGWLGDVRWMEERALLAGGYWDDELTASYGFRPGRSEYIIGSDGSVLDIDQPVGC